MDYRKILAQKAEGKNYFIETYGCQMNAHDSEKLAGLLEELGFSPCKTMDEADLILFNTCCVRDNAEKKVFGNVGALKQRKRKKRNLVIGVCGCMMQQKEVAKKLMDTFPFVNFVFGTKDMGKLPEMLYEAMVPRKRSFGVGDASAAMKENIPMARKKGPLASVNIMQGCNNFCSYCIVPYVRGREQSREPGEIIEEVEQLREQGFREVMLLGQNVNSYGRGLENGISFAQLLKATARTGIERIRFMTSHPKDLSDELIDTIAGYTQICNQIHLPVQAGSDRILQLMNRGYDVKRYLRIVDEIRKKIPGAAITTDIIVGFPGETEEDFKQTLDLVREVEFDAAFTFIYSLRTGTKAATMPGHLPEEVKSERIGRLIELQSEITSRKNLRYEGTRQYVLVEDISKRETQCVCGRTDTGKMVNFEGEKALIGKIVPVTITKAKKTTLYGCMEGNV